MTNAVSRALKAQIPNALQISGLATFAVGAFVLTPWLGFMVAGIFLCLIGWAVDKPKPLGRGEAQ